jgi:serine/threonine protein kinase
MSHKFMLLIKQSSPLDLQREGKKPVEGKRYFAGTLEEMIMDYHLKQMSLAEKRKELDTRKVFADFLRGLVECDPNKRWTPTQVYRFHLHSVVVLSVILNLCPEMLLYLSLLLLHFLKSLDVLPRLVFAIQEIHLPNGGSKAWLDTN